MSPPAPDLALGIEAATPDGGIALAEIGGGLLANLWRAHRSPISASLLADLDHLLGHGGLSREQVRAVGLSLGPGSFTGLRVGLALAKTLARGWGAALYGFSTLELTARRWPVPGEAVAVLLDARRGELYGGLYRAADAGAPPPLRPDAVEPLESLIETLAALGEPVVFMGDGAWRHREAINHRLGARARWAPPHLGAPDAAGAALAAAEAFASGAPPLDPLAAAPLYLRPSDAERRHADGVQFPWS